MTKIIKAHKLLKATPKEPMTRKPKQQSNPTTKRLIDFIEKALFGQCLADKKLPYAYKSEFGSKEELLAIQEQLKKEAIERKETGEKVGFYHKANLGQLQLMLAKQFIVVTAGVTGTGKTTGWVYRFLQDIWCAIMDGVKWEGLMAAQTGTAVSNLFSSFTSACSQELGGADLKMIFHRLPNVTRVQDNAIIEVAPVIKLHFMVYSDFTNRGKVKGLELSTVYYDEAGSLSAELQNELRDRVRSYVDLTKVDATIDPTERNKQRDAESRVRTLFGMSFNTYNTYEYNMQFIEDYLDLPKNIPEYRDNPKLNKDQIDSDEYLCFDKQHLQKTLFFMEDPEMSSVFIKGFDIEQVKQSYKSLALKTREVVEDDDIEGLVESSLYIHTYHRDVLNRDYARRVRGRQMRNELIAVYGAWANPARKAVFFDVKRIQFLPNKNRERAIKEGLIYMSADFASTAEATLQQEGEQIGRKDYTVITVWSYAKEEHLLYLVDMAKFQSAKAGDITSKMLEFEQAYRPTKLLVETDAHSNYLMGDLLSHGYPRDKLHRRAPAPAPAQEPDTKKFRARSLSEIIRLRRMVFPSREQNSAAKAAIEEMANFEMYSSKSSRRPDDFIDAASLATREYADDLGHEFFQWEGLKPDQERGELENPLLKDINEYVAQYQQTVEIEEIPVVERHSDSILDCDVEFAGIQGIS